MRIGIIADVHLGNHRRMGGPVEAGLNRRARQGVDVLRRAAFWAYERKCDELVVAGDLFDSARPEPQLIAAAMSALREGPNVLILKGNHDSVSDADGDHALGPFREGAEGQFVVFDRPARWPGKHGELLLVPFRSGDAREWLPAALDEAIGEVGRPIPLSLFLHLGIADGDTPAWLQGARDSVAVDDLEKMCRARGIAFAGAGNWHNPGSWDGDGVKIAQVGALCPTGFDNEGLDYGRLAVWDSDRRELEWHSVPGPRFVKVPAAALLRLKDSESLIEKGLRLAKNDGCDLYLEVAHDPGQEADAVAGLRRLMDDGVVCDGELRADSGLVAEAARGAAAAVRGAETLDAALAGYVEEMTLPDGVARADVLERARKYLAAAEG